MKIPSSRMFELCLHAIEAGQYNTVCAALVGIEYDLRMQYKENIVTNANKIWLQFKPKNIRDDVKMIQPWWSLRSPERIETLQRAIELAQKKGD